MLDIEQLALEGRLFDNQYILVRPLSKEGGSADVWLALDNNTAKAPDALKDVLTMDDEALSRLGLLVAIKTYRPKNALDIEGQERFREEYTIVFNCHHANLIHPTHFSIFEDIPYLVLPYCQQGSSELLTGNMVEKADIYKYVGDVAAGLAYLHRCEPPIIHLDIKPANVLLDDFGNYAITDFGISAQSKGNTAEGEEGEEVLAGTAAYMAPERFELGFTPSKESDIWAVGATLYELVTGKLPYGEEGGYAQPEGKVKLEFPKGIAADVQRLICSCLDEDPAKRPTAEELEALAREKLSSTKRAKWMKIIAVAAVAAVVAVAAFIAGNKSSNEGDDFKKTLKKQISQKTNPQLFAEAMEWVNANNADSLKNGLQQLEQLAKKKYVPAIYELACTYGWVTEERMLARKKLLQIETFPSSAYMRNFMPVSDSINSMAMARFEQVVQLAGAEYDSEKMNASYRLAFYHIFLKRNKEKALLCFEEALGGAQKVKDKEMIDNCRAWKKHINTYGLP